MGRAGLQACLHSLCTRTLLASLPEHTHCSQTQKCSQECCRNPLNTNTQVIIPCGSLGPCSMVLFGMGSVKHKWKLGKGCKSSSTISCTGGTCSNPGSARGEGMALRGKANMSTRLSCCSCYLNFKFSLSTRCLLVLWVQASPLLQMEIWNNFTRAQGMIPFSVLESRIKGCPTFPSTSEIPQ